MFTGINRAKNLLGGEHTHTTHVPPDRVMIIIFKVKNNHSEVTVLSVELDSESRSKGHAG